MIALRQKRVIWFVNRSGRFEELEPQLDGFYHSETFPGLWLNPVAFIVLDGKSLLNTLRIGLNTTEHAEFLKRLQ